ncbi:MAG: twin-arginine translocation signal domain-containing protein [Myxococcales bacterium]|nr:twin-arginine translocation signal domain-containing protein [Myxococcales bacterium]
MTRRRLPPAPATRPTGLSRRRLLGGALTAALAAALVPKDQAPEPRRARWHATPRWIGHA